jgi:hypothetical protein
MKTLVAILATLSLASVAFGAEPAKAAAAPAPAAPDCDVCKAHMAYLKAGKVVVHKLDNGLITIVTTDAKGKANLEKASAELDTQFKAAFEGKAKLDENCTKMVDNMKAGKIFMGHGAIKDGFASSTMSNDPEIAKGLIEMADKMAPAAPAKGKK